MFANRAFNLIKELERSTGGSLPPFDENGLRQIYDEMNALFERNQRDVTMSVAGNSEVVPGLYLRHAALERNKQCVMSYLYNRITRIRDLRWEEGSVLSENVRLNTTEQEQQFFKNYNKSLANYMRSIGEGGLDLTEHMTPPKVMMSQVKVLKDWELEDESVDGGTIILRKDSLHFLARSQSDPLVRQGVLEYVKL